MEASNESVKGSGIDTNRLREFLFPLPSGLSWEKIKPTTKGRQLKPTKGRELTAPKLAEALAKQTQFSQEEWKRFDIKDLRYDHFIQSRGAFFEPLSSFIRSGNTYLRPLSKYFQSVAYFRPADQAKSIGDDASNYIEIDDKYYYIEIDDKYFQVSAVTNANQAARNLVPTASYSGEGACVNVWFGGVILFACVYACLHMILA